MFRSVRKVDCSSPLTFSFDVESYNNNFNVTLEDLSSSKRPFSLTIDTNKQSGTKTEIIENIFNNKQDNHIDNSFGGEKVMVYYDESISGIKSISEDGKTIYSGPSFIEIENGYRTYSGSLETLESGAQLYFLTTSPKSDNVIINELGTFEKRDAEAYKITPFIIEVEKNVPLLLEADDNSVYFLVLGHEVTKDYSLSNTTEYTVMTNDDYKNEFQTTQDILKVPYRARFVISNDGRSLSFSRYNEDKKIWECVKNFLFNIPKVSNDGYILFQSD